MLTSGNEDHIRIWHFPWLNSTAEFKAPVNETATTKENKIDDADYSADGEFLAIVTPAMIHIRSKKDDQFVATVAPSSDYMFRCARFIKEKGKKNSFLVTVENAKGKGKPVLCIWKVDSWTRYSSVKLRTRLRVTTMSVSENGRFIAVGAADGTVAVYDSRLYVRFR